MTDQPVASTGIAPTPDSVHDAGRHDALEAALAFYESRHDIRTVPNTALEHGRTLAAAVRDLREQVRVMREAQGEADVRLAGVEAERDRYRHVAEQKWALRKEVEDILGVPHNAASDAQFMLGVEALRKSVAELDALKGRTCDGCRDSLEATSGARFCVGPGHGVACEEFGFTCGAWQAREGA